MTEERSCKTCRLSSSNNVTGKLCRYFGETCNDYNYFSKWQPIAQEKPMENKVIFESEEECAEFLCNVYNHNKEYSLRSLVPMAKQKGYIRKSALEEAEEMYDNMIKNYSTTSGHFKIAVDYINMLKSEIERLKK